MHYFQVHTAESLKSYKVYFLATTDLNKNSVTVIHLTVYWRSEFTDNLTEGWTEKIVCYILHLNIIVQKISIKYHKTKELF